MPNLVLRAYGVTVALSAPQTALDVARDALPPSYCPVDATSSVRWAIRRRSEGWVATAPAWESPPSADLDAAVRVVLSDLELWVAEHAKRRVFVHAGCVAFDGVAIVLPGRSMAGKTSLTAALVRAGGTYYSDEFAVLDSGGAVRPYGRKLAVRPYDGSPPRRVAVSDLGGRVGRGPVPVGLIAVLMYSPGNGWVAEPLTPGRAVLRLLDNAVAARSRPRAVLQALGAVAEGAPALEGTRGDADEAAARLLARLPRQAGQ